VLLKPVKLLSLTPAVVAPGTRERALTDVAARRNDPSSVAPCLSATRDCVDVA
jgi:hypothetical protein